MGKLPILVLAFNRKDHVIEALKAIRKYKPERLYLSCDGPREHKLGETKVVTETREAMLQVIDWPCKVMKLFQDKNLGCANAVFEAISWFFKHEEYGIICEDDIVLSPDFFRFCELLLPRYKNEEKIMQISARNTSFRTDIQNTYVYSQCYHCWGWATWRRAWAKMDMNMSSVPQLSFLYLIKRLGIFRGLFMKYYFFKAYKSLPYFNSWATRWYLSIIANDGLVICPGVNLALNIGLNSGTHFSKDDTNPYPNLRLDNFNWPIIYNDVIKPDIKQRKYDNKSFFKMRICGLKKILKKHLKFTYSLFL